MWVWTVFASMPAKPKLHPRLQLLHRFSWNFNPKLGNTKPPQASRYYFLMFQVLVHVLHLFLNSFKLKIPPACCIGHTQICALCAFPLKGHANTNRNHKLGLCYVGTWAVAENSTLTFNRTLCEGFQLYPRGCHCFGSLQAYKRCLREAAGTEAPGYSLIITVS